MMGDDKNCTPNSVGLFCVQNQVIRAWLSTLPARGLLWWCPDPEMSSKFGWNFFLQHWLKMIRTAPKQCGFKTESSDPIFNFTCSKPTLVVSGAVKVVEIWPKKFSVILLRACTVDFRARKSHQNLIETLFSHNEWKW